MVHPPLELELELEPFLLSRGFMFKFKFRFKGGADRAARPAQWTSQSFRKIGMIRMARMFTTLIIGLIAGPAVSL